MIGDYILKVDPQEFWNCISDFFEEDRLADPSFHKIVIVHLLLWDEDTWHLKVTIHWNGEEKYRLKWDEFYVQIKERGWVIRDFTAEERKAEEERKRLGLEGCIILETTWRTNPDYFFPHLKEIVREGSMTDGPLSEIGTTTINIDGGKEFLIGWGTFNYIGFVNVIKINDIESRIIFYCYQSQGFSDDDIKFYKIIKQFIEDMARRLSGLYMDNERRPDVIINASNDKPSEKNVQIQKGKPGRPHYEEDIEAINKLQKDENPKYVRCWWENDERVKSRNLQDIDRSWNKIMKKARE